MRFSPPSWDRGKSGALRVAYVHYEEFGHILLVAVYPKNTKDTLSAAEKNAIKAMIQRQHELLSQHYDP